MSALKTLTLSAVLAFGVVASAQGDENKQMVKSAERHLSNLAGDDGIGVRLAGKPSEVQAADYLQKAFTELGLQVERQNFDFTHRRTKEALKSQNIIAHKPGKSGKSIIIGGHYDSTAAQLGSLGVTDNAASIAVMLSLAESISKTVQQEIGVTFIAFGAEEVGLVGANEFVKKASPEQMSNYIGMINLDGIVGSDRIYIHSALSTPYRCQAGTEKYAFSSKLRDTLYQIASDLLPKNTFEIHPGFEGYPAGETGGWSDHAPFACAGLPIGNFESTNFAIYGESGRDGYSQSTHPELWDCFDPETIGACDREKEKKWGKIWHTGNDRLDVLERLFPGRINQQLSSNLTVLSEFLSNLDKYGAKGF